MSLTPLSPSVDAATRSRIAIAVGLMALISAGANFVLGPVDLTGGRWGELQRFFSLWFGENGWPIAKAVVGLVFIVWGLALHPRNQNVRKGSK